MKIRNILFLLIPAAILAIAGCKSDGEGEAVSYKYDYETFQNDDMQVMIYTLENGLKVYMSINRDEPRIQTNIAVRTGSKQDPADATGLAHYLEHMMFKGTSNIGTVNWEAEKVLLQEISDLYEQHRNTTDPEERKAIYAQIDAKSNEASGHAVANEYDKMIASLGAKGTNAYTWLEETVYVNDIPSNELNKWLMVEGERFSELVLRLFHTELEAVYEEYNRGLDSDGRQVFQQLFANLFQKHSYGTQTTIGTGEHLKNPSMVKIHEYWKTYYVPNNIAIILAGDIDPDATVDMVKEHFGDLTPKDVPEFTFEPEDETQDPIESEIFGSDPEFVQIGFRLPGAGTDDALKLQLVDMICSNGQAGLIDLNLEQKQVVLSAGSSPYIFKDYSVFMLSGSPRAGQTLEEVRDLLMAQLDLVKAGDFPDWLPDAVRKDFALNDMRAMESNRARASEMTDAFIQGRSWQDMVDERDKMNAITKEQLVAFANEKLTNNYTVVYKRMGESNYAKVEKPAITPVKLERDTTSQFFAMFDTVKSDRLKPMFMDFDKDIARGTLNSGVEYSYIENVTNDLFSLHYILDMGSDHDKELALAVKYLPFLGSSKYTAEELQQEFYKLGLSFDVFTSRDRCYLTLSGLEESLEPGVKLFEEFLADVQPDEKAYQDMVDGVLKERQNAMLQKFRILYSGLMNYAKYGSDNPFKNIIPETELKAIDPATLASKLKDISSYKHQVFFYGKRGMDDMVAFLNTEHQVPEELQDYPEPKQYTELAMESNKVFYSDYDMVQSEMLMLSKGSAFNKDVVPQSRLFNEYFGSGLSSIVFQEIRESKALAYSAYSVFTTPSKKEDSHYVQAYIGSQVDKLSSARDAMLELMNDMPEAEIQFESARDAALKKIETSRTTKSSIFWSYLSAKRKGLDYDQNKEAYEQIQNMKMEDLRGFFNDNIKGRDYTFCVIGAEDMIDKSVLESMGEFKQLSLEELFGYEQKLKPMPEEL